MNKYQKLGFDTNPRIADVNATFGASKLPESKEIITQNDLILNFSMFLPENVEFLEVQKNLETLTDFIKITLRFDSLPNSKDFIQINQKPKQKGEKLQKVDFHLQIKDFETIEDEDEKEEITTFLRNFLFQMRRTTNYGIYFTGGNIGEDFSSLSSDLVFNANCGNDVCEIVKNYVSGTEYLENYAKQYLEIVEILESGVGLDKKIKDKHLQFLYKNNREIFEKLYEYIDLRKKINAFSSTRNKKILSLLKKQAIRNVIIENLSWFHLLEQDHQNRLEDFKNGVKKSDEDLKDVDASEIEVSEVVNEVLNPGNMKQQSFIRKKMYELSQKGVNLFTEVLIKKHGANLKSQRKELEAESKKIIANLDNENLDLQKVFETILNHSKAVEKDLTESTFFGKAYEGKYGGFVKKVARKVDVIISTKEQVSEKQEKEAKIGEQKQQLLETSFELDKISAFSRGINPDFSQKAKEYFENAEK